MAKLLGCRLCMVDFVRIELADGSVALVCGACDVIGVEHEVARGGPLWADGWRIERARSAKSASAEKAARTARSELSTVAWENSP